MVELLLAAEFACNNAIHTSTTMNLFWVNYHYHQVIQPKATRSQSVLKSEIELDTFTTDIEETPHSLH